MISLDMYLARLVKEGVVTMEEALDKSAVKEELKRYINI